MIHRRGNDPAEPPHPPKRQIAIAGTRHPTEPRFLACAFITAFLAVACGPVRDSTTTTDPGPQVTTVTIQLQQRWDIAWAPSGDFVAGLQHVLDTHGLQLLRPRSPFESTEPLMADVAVVVASPGGRATADITVRRSDLSVVVAIQTTPLSTQPRCSTRSDEWTPNLVRGVNGCALLVADAVSSIDWAEGGQYFHAEFGPETDAGLLVHWLDTWSPVATP